MKKKDLPGETLAKRLDCALNFLRAAIDLQI